MRRFAALSLALMLAAFAPPQPEVDAPRRAQQALPKSWIPEKAPEKAPPITLDVTPRALSAYSHGVELTCQPQRGQSAAPREFVESYWAAMTAFRNDQFAEAVRLAEVAAAYAKDARQWSAIEQIRIGAFDKLGNDAELVASLQAALAAKDCLTSQQTADYREQLEKARKRLGAPR